MILGQEPYAHSRVLYDQPRMLCNAIMLSSAPPAAALPQQLPASQAGSGSMAAWDFLTLTRACLLGARCPRHPFWAAVIAELHKRYDAGIKTVRATGPRMLTDVVEAWVNRTTALALHYGCVPSPPRQQA